MNEASDPAKVKTYYFISETLKYVKRSLVNLKMMRSTSEDFISMVKLLEECVTGLFGSRYPLLMSLVHVDVRKRYSV